MTQLPPSILIVDDEQAVWKFLSEYFHDLGYRVLVAETGGQGFFLYQTQRPEAVLLDLCLPDVSGLEVLERISADDDETALIVISGMGSMDDVIAALRHGAWDYLVKPFVDLHFVEHAVTKALERMRLKRENRLYREHLEDEVQRRTVELRQEIQMRKQIEDDLRRSELRYRELSLTDDLTGLYNARHFFRQMQVEVERSARYGSPLSLCIMDIDNFKIYNDTYGHLCGDAVLAELGRIVRKLVRESDSAYRYGGEEFILLLPETPREEAGRVAERVRQAFFAHAFYPQRGVEVHVSLSQGVTGMLRGEAASDLLERADRNMYAAKKAGRNITISR